ncbi:MAG: SRPBCC domain-containing protein [Catenulispora sp.]|nr:SRPBCC domain-containing protein [Catenulispora sp.]
MTDFITVSVTRVIDASCDKVWRADTEPRHFEQWFGAKPGSARTDLRTGGTWSAVVTPGGEEIELEGRYVEVIENRRVVMTVPNGPETLEVALDFKDLGDGRTEVTSSTEVAAQAKAIVEETAAGILAEVARIAESL